MGRAQIEQCDFRGGVWSKTATANHFDPKYKTSMTVCQNGYPMAEGAWMRRQGTMHDGFTKAGLPARLLSFEFEEAYPYQIEMSSGTLRYWASNGKGLVRATTNDSVGVASVSGANPCIVDLQSSVNWATGNTVFFTGLNAACTGLMNRTFIWTSINSTNGTLTDELTGATINGSTIGTFGSGTINRVQENTSLFIGNLQQLETYRLVQTENAGILLGTGLAPWGLTVITLPQGNNYAQFSLQSVEFLDGPYYDPPTNGAQLTPNQTTGVVQLTLNYPLYVATTSYAAGQIVTYSGTNYQSLQNLNVGNTPSSSPSWWSATNGNAGVNNGQGFLPSDIGRLVRLQSKPAAWTSTGNYSEGQVVSYNPSNTPGGDTYWSSLVGSNSGNIPGADITHWQLIPPGAQGLGSGAPMIWTWGEITGLLNFIPGQPANVAYIGNCSSPSNAFNGQPTQDAANSSGFGVTASGLPTSLTLTSWLGQNFSGCSTSAYKIQSVTVFGSTDQSLVFIQQQYGDDQQEILFSGTLYLFGSNSAPSAWNNGTLLGSTPLDTGNTIVPGNEYPWVTPTQPNAYTIVSNNQTTAYSYIWVAIQYTVTSTLSPMLSGGDNALSSHFAQIQLVAAPGSNATANGIQVELLGPPLLYTAPIISWCMGLYSTTSGYPTCGTYADGRVWLAGSVANRVDACCSNGVTVNSNNQITINMAPTDQYGNVTAANAIAYTFNTPGANPIYWLEPDQQGILAGTQAGEHLIYAPATTAGLSPLNIAERQVTKIRCANVLPVRTEHTLAFVQSHGRKLMEYFPDVFSGKFTAPDLSEKWKHLTVSNIAELAYQQELVPVIWMRTNAGVLIGATYKRDTLMTSSGPTFIGAHYHPLGSGNTVVSVSSGPSEGGNLDALSLVTFDGTYYHVETLTDMFEETDTIAEAWFLDNAIVPPTYSVSGSTVVISGLWHLNGKTCTAFCGTLDCGDWPVSNGSMTVPMYTPAGTQTNTAFTSAFVSAYSGAMPIIVGFTYTSQGQLARPDEPQQTGSRLGPALGERRKIGRFAAEVINTQGISFGTSFTKLHAFQFQSDGGILYASNALYSGVTFRESLREDWSYDGKLCWQISRPWPGCIGAIAGVIETSEN